MMPRITIICTNLLLLPIFFGFIYAQDEILVCNIKDGQKQIHLKLRKTEQLLANEHLPVWSVNSRKRAMIRFVNEKLGHFIFYHDKEKSAAVVLFMESKTLYGMVDTRYVIIDLPVGECSRDVEIGQYVRHSSCPTMTPGIHYKPSDHPIQPPEDSVVELDDPSPFVPGNDGSMTHFYPEIMVFVSYDVTEKNMYQNDYRTMIVSQYLGHFNAMDMLLSKLSTDHIKIHLNLAGIMIEEQPGTFKFLERFYLNPQFVDVDKTHRHFLHYATRNLVTFSHDSFDFFFISTGRKLFHFHGKIFVEGFSWFPDAYDARCKSRTTPFWTGAIARSTCGFEYISAAHEIAHLMHVNHDLRNKGYCVDNKQCYAIMQEVAEYCVDCLRWSDKSVNDLRIYSSQHRDRCYLLNKPRSLHPYGTPIQTLTPSEQCRCYGFQPSITIRGTRNRDVIPRGGCRQSLICGNDAEGLNLPLPIDGTPCENNGLCWDRVCRRIPTNVGGLCIKP